jgi:hypothetical protein
MPNNTVAGAPEEFRTPDPQIRSLMLHSDERTHRSLQSWRRRPSGLYQAALGHARRYWQLVATRATPHVYRVPPRSFDRAQCFELHYRCDLIGTISASSLGANPPLPQTSR